MSDEDERAHAMNGRQMWDIAKSASPKDGWRESMALISPKERDKMERGRSNGISAFATAGAAKPTATVRFARCTDRLDGLEHIVVTLSEDGAEAALNGRGGGYLTAASGAVMKGAEQHCVEITVLKRIDGLRCGVIRPEFDVRNAEQACDAEEHCFYDTRRGYSYPGPNSWDGCQGAGDGDRIGLLLDLKAGSLTVYKNDARLGMITSAGLKGEYCWAICMYGQGSRVRIEAKPLPSEFEQAAAMAAKMQSEEQQVRKTRLSSFVQGRFILKPPSFCQDRLGTNIEDKLRDKRRLCFSRTRRHTRSSRRRSRWPNRRTRRRRCTEPRRLVRLRSQVRRRKDPPSPPPMIIKLSTVCFSR
jgi:hypothetical protein